MLVWTFCKKETNYCTFMRMKVLPSEVSSIAIRVCRDIFEILLLDNIKSILEHLYLLAMLIFNASAFLLPFLLDFFSYRTKRMLRGTHFRQLFSSFLFCFCESLSECYNSILNSILYREGFKLKMLKMNARIRLALLDLSIWYRESVKIRFISLACTYVTSKWFIYFVHCGHIIYFSLGSFKRR